MIYRVGELSRRWRHSCNRIFGDKEENKTNLWWAKCVRMKNVGKNSNSANPWLVGSQDKCPKQLFMALKKGIQGTRNQSLASGVDVGFLGSLGQERLRFARAASQNGTYGRRGETALV
jgi:hypothetical protein